LLLDGAPSPRDVFWFYWMDDLAAVRSGRWKLHLARRGQEVEELYDLVDDPGETTDLRNAHPDLVAELQALAAQARTELGDARLGMKGQGIRRLGEVDHAVPLTVFDPDHPYYMSEYDLPDRG
jgi:arylsulfatase A-like enzyme